MSKAGRVKSPVIHIYNFEEATLYLWVLNEKKKEDENTAKEEQIRKHIKYLIKYKYIKKFS